MSGFEFVRELRRNPATKIIPLIFLTSLDTTEDIIEGSGLGADLKKAFPTASAIIAAYLPNEAVTVEETIEAFFRVNYPSDFK
jgi:DNA-binding response OmpR family regulator